MDPTPFKTGFAHQNSFTLGPADPAGVLRKNGKNIHEPKRTRFSWNAIVCETPKVSGGNSVFPIFQKYVSDCECLD
jgi:hypothetical protein